MHRSDETVLATRWQLAHPSTQSANIQQSLAAIAEWREVEVPCSIQTSSYGLPLEQLYQRDRVNSVRWMEEEYWFFRTRFARPAVGEDEEAVYQLLGVDYHCDILLNGKLLLSHEGMFSPIEVPLEGLREDNELVVVIRPYAEAQGVPETLKARYSVGNGWDFAPKLQSCGIWDDAALVVRPRLHVRHAAVATRLDNQQRADATVQVELSETVERGELVITLDGVRRTFPLVDAQRLALPINIPSPTLWWPNGMGEPELVELYIELHVDGRITKPYRLRTGLRAVERVAAAGQGVEDIPLQLRINHHPVFLNGVNWVPLDACPGSISAERYRPFLQQFKDAGVNLIRVWGGGLKEKEAFYRLADEFGLMVLQEFPLACQTLPRSEAFYRLLTQEVSAIIRQLAGHPSVVIWSGGNELFHYWDLLDSGSERMAATLEQVKDFGFTPENRAWHLGAETYHEPTLALMGSLCALLDGARPFQPTSAMEGEGEAHGIWTWNPAIGDHRFRDADSLYDFWLHARAHLYSECSVSSIANLDTIKDVLDSPCPTFPEKDDPIWRLHHAFYSAWDQLPDLWLDLPATEKLFGKLSELATLVLVNQWMQGEGARFLIEELRRQMPRTCGIIWWGVNEPWPGLAGNALLDYFARPKLGMRFLANAYRPTILSLRYQHCVARRIKPELWLSHNGVQPFAGHYQVQVRNLRTGEVDEYAGAVNSDRYTSRCLRTLLPLRLPAGTRAHVTCTLTAGAAVVHQNDYFFASNEDAVPFDEEMVGLIRRLYAAETGSQIDQTVS